MGRGNDGKGKLITCKVFEQRNMLRILWDFPGGPGVKNLPSDVGNGGLIPDWGTKIAHALRQLRQHTATREVHALQ